jgi:DNA-binding beta-propeller fold protein YncE
MFALRANQDGAAVEWGRREFLTLACGAMVSSCGRHRGERPVSYHVWGGQGVREGSFIRPRAIAADETAVYVIDTTGRVQVFDADGAYLRGFHTPAYENGTPTSAAFNRAGNLITPDTHYSRILEYTPTGELVKSWGSYGPGPDQFIYPTGIVQALDGRYYVSEYGEAAERVHVFDAEARFLMQWGSHGSAPGQFNRAMSIALDAEGMVYVSDTANHRVQCFSPEGKLVRIISGPGDDPGQLKYPHGIAFSPDGTLFVCEFGAHRVSRFTAGGEFIATYGHAGRAGGEFNGPRGIAVAPSGMVLVADTDNHRIQRFDPGPA